MSSADRGGSGLVGRLRDAANTSLIVMFVALIVVLAGWTIANQMGVFSDSGQDGDPCSTVQGRSLHEHARLEVYLNSSQPYDFSPDKYQLAEQFIHLEHGEGDADGAVMHIHQSRPTLACFFHTINWQVSEDRIVTDTGDVYAEDANHELEILVNGEPASDGFDTILEQGQTWEVRYTFTGPSLDGGDGTDGNGNETGNETGGNQTAGSDE